MAPAPAGPASLPRAEVDFDALAENLQPLANAKRLRLLAYLRVPRYMEEVASFMQVNRTAAKKHMDQLVEQGLVTKQAGSREHGMVMEYRLVPERLFELFDTMRRLGTLRPAGVGKEDGGAVLRTKAIDAGVSGRGKPGEDPRLVVVYGVDLGLTLPLDGKKEREGWVIGRNPDCDVRLSSDPFVSGRHAEVQRQGGGFVVTDLFSRNGTRIEWEPIPPGTPKLVENGDVVGIGKTILLFRDR